MNPSVLSGCAGAVGGEARPAGDNLGLSAAAKGCVLLLMGMLLVLLVIESIESSPPAAAATAAGGLLE
jgi:hypothetical protein